MTVRLIDSGGGAALKGLDGKINYAAISVDTDNDNTPENPLDLDMTVLYKSKEGTSYTKYSHIYKKMRGLPERSQDLFEGFAVVKYEDSDGNGFFDLMSFDWDGNGAFDEVISLRALGLSDESRLFKSAELKYKDYNRLYSKMADSMWKQAQYAVKAASRLGLETKWYAIYGSPKSIRQKYDFGFWLQLYIYHDIIDMARRTGDASLEQNAARAYASSSWELLKKWK